MACQLEMIPTQPVVSQIDKGRENQRLRSEKQREFANVLEPSLRRRGFQKPACTLGDLRRAISPGPPCRLVDLLRTLLDLCMVMLRTSAADGAQSLRNSVCVWGRTVN